MVSLQSWVTSKDDQVGAHVLRHMVSPDDVSAGVEWAAAALPDAYALAGRIAAIVAKSGKPRAAEYLRNKLPTDKKTRSGDLGEIIGATYTTSELGYTTVARLRWKDHREMAMRGDDIIGFRVPESGPLELLKGEAKSIASLKTSMVDDADKALRADNGLPSSHALAFIADRLYEQGQEALADLIDTAQLQQGISQRQVEQLLFTLTGGNPCNLLRINTKAYREPVKRLVVGLQVRKHQAFVRAVFDKAVADA
jgi:hypothetical protein